MTHVKTPIRMTAFLAALIALQGCAKQQQNVFYDPWDQYELGKVYDCGDIQVPDVRHNTENSATPGFGCSHQSNMTLMVADPNDLVRPRAMTPVDPEARQRVLDAYRAGETTDAGAESSDLIE